MSSPSSSSSSSSESEREQRSDEKPSRQRKDDRDLKRKRSPSPSDDDRDDRERHRRREHSSRRERRRSRSRSSSRERSRRDRYRRRSPSNERYDERRRSRDDDDRGSKRRSKKRSSSPSKQKTSEAPVRPLVQEPSAESMKTGGVYIPPFRLAQMRKDVADKSSQEYQRMTWDALKKSINGLINKVNVSNIKNIIPELFAENLVRGKGLFARSCLKAQAASPNFTHVYAALIAVVNTKFPENGELILKRLIVQFRKAYRRNVKNICMATTRFLAHLVNQQVCGDIIALQLLTLLLESPTDDSVEVAVGFTKECGRVLSDLSPQAFNDVFERFRGILHEGEIEKRIQYMIEELFADRKKNFPNYPGVLDELDLVDPNDQITHEHLSLDDELDVEETLNYFTVDPNFEENEAKYEQIKKDILGDGSDDEDEGSSADSESDEAGEEEEESEKENAIQDETGADLLTLRRTIYLTIMSSATFEECGHKLLKILKPGQEIELCTMLIECCSQERTYLRFYGQLGQRFCQLNPAYPPLFESCFEKQYAAIYKLETNKLRNVSKFFAHLLYSDAVHWKLLETIHLNELETSASSRIFIKIMFQEMAEYMGLAKLNERLKDPFLQPHFAGLFPKDNPRNTRFSINFFTSIGLGGLTEDLREHLRTQPKLIMEQNAPVDSSSSSSDSDSSSSDSSSDSSDSDSSSSSSSSSSSESSSESSGDERRRRKRSRRD